MILPAAADVVVVGSINADLVLEVERRPLPGETVFGREATVMPGGKGANQALAAARWGATTALVGAVGSDSHAQVALSQLSAAGVDLTRVRQAAPATGLATVVLSDDGENSIIVTPGANLEVTPAAVDTAAEVISAARVCVLQAEIPVESVARAAELAREAGTRLVLNAAPAVALDPVTYEAADPLVVNEHEAAILLGATVDDPAAAAAALLARGTRSVIVTLGAAGLVGADGAGTWSAPARQVQVRDTTGAGDAFVGALAAELAAGSGLRDAAAIAARVASIVVTGLGTQGSFPGKDTPLP